MRVKNPLGRFPSRKSDPLMHLPHQVQSGLETLPDLIEPVVGWRTWRIWRPLSASYACPTFSSVILDTPWTPRREITAEHSFDLGAKCRGLLESACSCGIYAFRDPAEAFGYSIGVRDRLPCMAAEVAVGTVGLWGRVIECERGFKAQFAYPRHIYLPATISRYVSTVNSAFGVAVGIYASMREEEISLPVAQGSGGQSYQTFHLKKPDFPGFERFEFEVGFYELEPPIETVAQQRVVRSGIPLSGTGGSLEDGCQH